MIVVVPLIIITVLSHSRVILCQPLSSQLASNMILSQAYRLSGISWHMGLNYLILLNIKKVILLHNNIRMMKWMKLHHRIELELLCVTALSTVCIIIILLCHDIELCIPYFLEISPHLEIPPPSKCRCIYLPTRPNKRRPRNFAAW